jgi:pimeloyl-ACP methyl ester carboxylesterase
MLQVTGDMRRSESFEWQDGGRRWRVPFDRFGVGPPLVCFPAPSTISTREELRGVAERLASTRAVFTVDWPGLGDADRFPVRYRAPVYERFIAAFLERVQRPVDVLAAGHAASYALDVGRRTPELLRRLVLLAPTWRGPLPTAMGDHPMAWGALESLVCAPLVGGPLYALNASRSMIHWMMRRHVYADPSHITPELLERRARIAHSRNARFAAAAFVTGALDCFRSRDDFLEAARGCAAPKLVAIGERTPPKSLAEMRALTAVPRSTAVMLPGSLAFYDEYPEKTARAVAAFLASD